MNRSRDFLVGIVIIVAVSVAVVGTLWLQGTNFGRVTTVVDVLTETAGQVSEGNRVTYRGVRIGQVSNIMVEPGGGAVRITLLLDGEVPLPEDAAVLLGAESLFGEWQAEIVSRARMERFTFFDVSGVPAGTVPVLGGYALPELTRLTASAEQISINLADLTDRLELAFNQETADNLASAIANIEAITEELRELVTQQGAVAASITESAAGVLEEVRGAAQAARTSFERVDGMLGDQRTDSILANVHIASAGLRELANQLSDEDAGVSATLERMDSAFVRIDRITARLEAGEGSLGRLLVDSAFAVRAEAALLQLDLLLQDVRENPHRYVRLSIF